MKPENLKYACYKIALHSFLSFVTRIVQPQIMTKATMPGANLAYFYFGGHTWIHILKIDDISHNNHYVPVVFLKLSYIIFHCEKNS